MKYEDSKFIIFYNECDKRYIDKIISIVNMRMPKILEFFKLKYDKKIVIKLYNDLDLYKNNLKNSFKIEAEIQSRKQNKKIEQREYCDFMIANTEDGNINMQSLDLVKLQDDYKEYTEEDFCFNACHEFVHLCQQQIGSTNPGWFWEVIATNLGNPECQHETNESFTIEDLEMNFDKIDGYGAVFKLGKYLFECYKDNPSEILEMIIDNEKLNKVLPNMILEVNNNKRK